MNKKVILRESKVLNLVYHNTMGSLLKQLNDLKDSHQVPDKATIDAWLGGYDEDEIQFKFKWYSEETEEECAARLEQEYWEKKRVEDDEKIIYQRLKAKFEKE